MKSDTIDNGNIFDWRKTFDDYSKIAGVSRIINIRLPINRESRMVRIRVAGF